MNEAIGYVRVSSEEHRDNGLASKPRLHRAKVGARVIPLLVTTGKRSSPDERGGWWVPRQQLAATLLVLLQSRPP
jgi:hypothetical protein